MLKLTINRSSGIVIFAGAERVRVLSDDRCRLAIDAVPSVAIRREIMPDRLVPNWRNFDNATVLAAMEMKR